MSPKWLLILAVPALLAIACGGDGSSPTPSPPPSPSPGATLPSPTPEPTPTTEPAPTSGSPFAIVDLQATWEARGMAVTLSDPNADFSGFGATALDLRLARGADSMELSILVYKDLEVIKEDWELTVGESPMPKQGRAVPDHISIWWNENIVVVVRSSVGALSSDALDAFLALGEASVRQLAYVGTDGAIWLVNADGSGNTMFANVCSDQDIGDPLALAWSPPGDKLAVLCLSGDTPQPPLVVLDESGQPLIQAEGVVHVRWSPDGQRLAYQTSAFIGTQSPQYEVRMLDLTTLEDTSVAEDAFLLEWAQPDRLLVGLNVEDAGLAGLALNNDAHWLDLGTGETEPVPRFDDFSLIADLRQFWLSPDAKKAVLVEKGEAGPTLRIYDLETGEERPIPGSVIGYPSHGIPARQFAFSPDGTRLYWADANPEPTVIYRANMDGSGLTRLGAVPSRFLTLTGDGKVAYPAAGVPATIVVEDLEVGTRVEVGARVEVGEGFVTMAWRPTP